MSQLNVTTLKHESAGVDNLVLDSSGNATFGGVAKVGGLMNPSGSASAIAMDSAGRVTMPYQPAFCAYPNTSGTNQSAGNAVAYDTALTNIGNHYNPSTYKFTAPVAGSYYFAFSIWTGDTNTVRCGFYKNGASVGNSTFPIGTRNNGGSNDNDSGFMVIYLQASDVVDVRVYAGMSQVFGTNSFVGYLIG